MLSVAILSAIMLSVISLSVTAKQNMPRVIMLSVIMLNYSVLYNVMPSVVLISFAKFKIIVKRHNAECNYAKL